MVLWSLLRGLWRAPRKLKHRRHAKREARGRHAVTQGLLAIGHGDAAAARGHADAARRYVGNDPLALLLHAQSAQLDGDREAASHAFRAMAERSDTRLLGLRGLFIEAQRADDPQAAAAIAEEALRTSPGAGWASQAVLGLRCAQGDWSGALTILERNFEAGQIDKATHRRQRGVLLTARALDLETSDRDVARESVMEAVKLAPTLVPAAVLAARFHSEAHQTRRAMRTIETAWLAAPHPDLADAYAHVKLGDSARQRLVRVETLAAKQASHPESAMAIARAALDASEFSRARAALAPLVTAPTQRVAMLMAEIERSENGDSGRARAWTQRAVRALHDPVWTADGYVSDHWRPVSPVTGRLDAFHWQTPLAALPGAAAPVIEPDAFDDVRGAPLSEPPIAIDAPLEPSPPVVPEAEIAPEETPVEAAPAPPQPAPPLFRPRKPADSAPAPRAPPVIPIVRAPDDPGIDESDQAGRDEFADQLNPPPQQSGGWRGFLGRFGM
jgi:HemY protein